MTFTVIELEYVNPPNVGSIFGVPIGTIDQAIDLMKWAANGGNSEFSCTMIAPLNGTPTIQLEGRTTPTVRSVIGGDRWIVYDNGKLIVFRNIDEALLIYKPKGT